MKFIQNLLKKNQQNKDTAISYELRSHEFEKKLALIVNQIKAISSVDLKYVNITKLDKSEKDDLFNGYRLDFDTRDKLKKFKKKYKSLIL